MRDRRLTARLAAALVAVLLVAAACGDDEGGESSDATAVPVPDDTTTTTAPADVAGTGAQSPASGLRSGLTSLLGEHPYLLGAAAAQSIEDGISPDGPELAPAEEGEEGAEAEAPEEGGEADGETAATDAEAALAVLDENGQAMGDAFGSIYGLESGLEFEALWRERNVAMIQYALARSRGDDAAAQAAVGDITAAEEEIGAYFEANNTLDEGTVSSALAEQTASLSAALDRIAQDDPQAWTDLRAAAQSTPDTATALAGAIVEDQLIEGEVDDPGAELRADLTNLLQEHVYLLGGDVAEVAEAGSVSGPGVTAASATLDENTEEMGELFGEVYGSDTGDQFVNRWRAYTDAVLDWTAAVAAGDANAAEEAEAQLSTARDALGSLLAANNELLASEAVAAEIQQYIEAFLPAVEAIVAGDAERFEDLRAAAQTMPLVALTLASAIQLDL